MKILKVDKDKVQVELTKDDIRRLSKFVNPQLFVEIDKAISSLPNREAEVIKLYWGLDAGGPMTLEAIGARFGLTRERIRQIKNAGLRKVRASFDIVK